MRLPKELDLEWPDNVEDIEAIVRDCCDQIPMNWCDPLLTGPDAVIKDIDCRQVEALLIAIKQRILSRYGIQEERHE